MMRKHCLQDASARAAAKDPRSGEKGWEPKKIKANNNAVYEKLLVVEHTVTTQVEAPVSGEAVGKSGAGGDGRKGGETAEEGLDEAGVTRTVTTVLSEASGDCPVVMDAPKRTDVMKATVAADLLSCDAPFEVLPFVETDPRAEALDHANPLAPSACEAAVDAPGAFSFFADGQRIS